MKRTVSLILVLATILSLISISVIPANAVSSNETKDILNYSWYDEKTETRKTVIVKPVIRRKFLGYYYSLILIAQENNENLKIYTTREYYFANTVEKICNRDNHLGSNTYANIVIINQNTKALETPIKELLVSAISTAEKVTDDMIENVIEDAKPNATDILENTKYNFFSFFVDLFTMTNDAKESQSYASWFGEQIFGWIDKAAISMGDSNTIESYQNERDEAAEELYKIIISSP